MNPLLYIVAATAAFYKLNLTHTHINRNDSPSSLTTSSKQSLPTLAIYSDTSTILPATTICSGISVLDATIQLLDAKGIPYKLSTDAYGSYLTSINNINQSFNSAQNTWNAWLYTVNNTIPDKLSSDYIIKKMIVLNGFILLIILLVIPLVKTILGTLINLQSILFYGIQLNTLQKLLQAYSSFCLCLFKHKNL